MRKTTLFLLIVIGFFAPALVGRAQTDAPTPTPTAGPTPVGGGKGEILYSTKTDTGSEVFSINVDGTGKTQLTNTRNPKLWPSWSPDGKQILYEEVVGTINAVYVKDARLEAVPKDLVHGNYPRWTPDGKQIILAIDGGGTSIYVRNVDGTGNPQIVVKAKTAKESRTYPSMSIDGRIAYAGKFFTQGNYEIYITGISETLGAVSNTPVNDRYPVWDSSGSAIVYSNESDQICLIEISRITKTITNSSCFPNYVNKNSCPAWSPDGTQIAFVSYIYGEYKFYVMNRDGSNVHPLNSEVPYIWQAPNGFIRCSPISWK